MAFYFYNIPLGEFHGYNATVSNGKKLVHIQLAEGEQGDDFQDGRVTLNLERAGKQNVWIAQQGKKYPCGMCGGTECQNGALTNVHTV